MSFGAYPRYNEYICEGGRKIFHEVMRGLPGNGMVGKALGSTRRRGSGDGGGVNSLRTCRFDGSSMRWICATILGCCGFDASMAMTVLLFAGDGGGVRR